MDVIMCSGSIRHASGITLIEVIITLTIAITISLMSTSIGTIVRSTQNLSYTHEFLTTLNFARTEAIKYGVPVSVCRTINGKNCDGKIIPGSGKAWDTGWIVFYDYNGNGVFNNSRDEIIQVHEALRDGFTLRSKSRVRITYKSTGIAPGFMDTWTFCDPGRDRKIARGVILAYSGRAAGKRHGQQWDQGQWYGKRKIKGAGPGMRLMILIEFKNNQLKCRQ